MKGTLFAFIVFSFSFKVLCAPAEKADSKLVSNLKNKVELTAASVDNLKVEMKKDQAIPKDSSVVISFYCSDLKGKSENCKLIEAYPVQN